MHRWPRAAFAVLVVMAVPGISMRADHPDLISQTPIPTVCIPVAFGSPAVDRPIDKTGGCGLEGLVDDPDPTTKKNHELQNQIKNEFCAWQNVTPALVTKISFDALTNKLPVGFPFGDSDHLPDASERAAIRALHTTTEGDTIGEGSYVQFVAYILEGHFGGAESVNCGRTKRVDLDIHLALTEQQPWNMNLAGTTKRTECESITAEFSPHHRPVEWDDLGRMTKSPASEKLKGGQQKLKDVDLQRPLRIRGQLFFDASHKPCVNHAPIGTNPARRSNWEIHPIYGIDVCTVSKSRSQCPIDGNVWMSLEDWLASQI